MRSGRLLLAAVIVLAGVRLATWAQDAEVRPKPGSKLADSPPSTSKPALRGALLISADTDCDVTVDGAQKFTLQAGATRSVLLTFGSHLITAEGAHGEGAVKRVAAVRDGVRNTFAIGFKTSGGGAGASTGTAGQASTTTGGDSPTGLGFVNDRDGLAYVRIPGGAFQMGCVTNDRECNEDERPRHSVRLSHAFYLGKTEVTVKAFERYRPESQMPDPPYFNVGWRAIDRAMVDVTWNDAADFCRWAGGRLPSEAEWEYAARGGRPDLIYPWGNSIGEGDAIYRTSQRYAPPSSTEPGHTNGFGLFAMAGNVAEWCADWYAPRFYLSSPIEEPTGPQAGLGKVIRGGSWIDESPDLRMSARKWMQANQAGMHVGFRCVLE